MKKKAKKKSKPIHLVVNTFNNLTACRIYAEGDPTTCDIRVVTCEDCKKRIELFQKANVEKHLKLLPYLELCLWIIDSQYTEIKKALTKLAGEIENLNFGGDSNETKEE